MTIEASSPGCKESGANAEHSPHLVPRLNGGIPPHSHMPSWLAKELPFFYHIHLKVLLKRLILLRHLKPEIFSNVFNLKFNIRVFLQGCRVNNDVNQITDLNEP